jgi:long-chain acyl-CoA synthetase
MAGLKRQLEIDDTAMDLDLLNKGATWPQVLKYNAQKFGDSHNAMRMKHYGIWQPVSWQEYYLQVKYLALGLITLGFQPGDRLLIIGDNAPQWYYAELAAQANHGISIGVYSDLSDSEITYIAGNSQAAFIVAEDQEQVDKILQIKAELPLLKKIIFWRYKGLTSYKESLIIGMRQIVHDGEEYEKQHPQVFENNVTSGKAEDPCAIIYTSGTTGTPKGAVHTFASLMYGAGYLLETDPLNEKDNIACFLPPAGITEQLLYIGCHLLSGSILCFAEAVETQQKDLREIGADLVYYGARLWESQARTVQANIQGADAFKRLIYRLFMPAGYQKSRAEFKHQKQGFRDKTVYAIANLLLFRPIRDSLGLPHTRICYTSGQILSPEALLFYHALGTPLKSIYGTTEGGILAIAKTNEVNLETVGVVATGTEVGITENGEIVYRQPGMFTQYYNNPEKTSLVLKDGWFYSGDTGSITEDRQIIFFDRKDDIVQLSNGETLAPQFIESHLKYSPYIKDAWVIAKANNPVIAAVIIIDYTSVGKWAGRNKIAYTTFNDLSQKQEVYGLINQEITRINKDISPSCRINRYISLHKEFDPDEGELTKDRKLRRVFLKEHYSDLVEAIFSGKSEVDTSFKLQYRDGRTGTVKTKVVIKDVKEASQ